MQYVWCKFYAPKQAAHLSTTTTCSVRILDEAYSLSWAGVYGQLVERPVDQDGVAAQAFDAGGDV